MISVRRLVVTLVLISITGFVAWAVTGSAAVLAYPSSQAAPTATPVSDPYAGLTVDELTSRSYGNGRLEAIRTITVTSEFTRSLITYPSDGLTIYGFMNTPRTPGHYPVVLVLHGYVAPARYRTTTYTTRYADAIASAGFVVIHPNYRDHPPSDPDPGRNLFRVGYAIDVLNLIALVKASGGTPGPLASADPSAIGLWGHSMGGGVALRVLTVSPDIRAAVLYGSMSADERANFERIKLWSGGAGGQELATPEDLMKEISPIYFLDRIRSAVAIHHGDMDPTVPPAWSSDLCRRLQALPKTVECFSYPNEPHVFTGLGDRDFIERTTAFLKTHLLPAQVTP